MRTIEKQRNVYCGQNVELLIVTVSGTPYLILCGGKIKKNEMGGACGTYGKGRYVQRDLVGKPERKRPLGRPRLIWEDNIKMALQEVGEDCGDWMEMAQDRDRWRALVSTVMNLRVPKMRGIS